MVTTSHVRRALAAQVVSDLRNIVECSLMFSPFSTSFWSSLALVHTASPAKLGVLLQFLQIGWMQLSRGAQKGFEIFIFVCVDQF